MSKNQWEKSTNTIKQPVVFYILPQLWLGFYTLYLAYKVQKFRIIVNRLIFRLGSESSSIGPRWWISHLLFDLEAQPCRTSPCRLVLLCFALAVCRHLFLLGRQSSSTYPQQSIVFFLAAAVRCLPFGPSGRSFSIWPRRPCPGQPGGPCRGPARQSWSPPSPRPRTSVWDQHPAQNKPLPRK